MHAQSTPPAARPAPFLLHARSDDDGAVVTCGGVLDETAEVRLRDAVQDALAGDPASLVLDCRRLRHVDGAGVSTILACAVACVERRVAFELVVRGRIGDAIDGVLHQLDDGPARA